MTEDLERLDAELDPDQNMAERIEDETISGQATRHYLQTAVLMDRAQEVLDVGGRVVPDLFPDEQTRDLCLTWLTQADGVLAADLIELGYPNLAALILRRTEQLQDLYT
jgi:hypothetical protein